LAQGSGVEKVVVDPSRPPDDRWYGLTDPAGITLSGRAERTGYDLVCREVYKNWLMQA
jgi:hypothetical protein